MNAKQLIKKIIYKPTQRLCRLEFQGQVFSGFNERSVEYAFLFKWISKICPKSVLDVGTGKNALPQLIRHCGSIVTAVDKIEGYWKGFYFNRHYHVLNDDITKTKIQNKYDMITCISVLEHIPNYNEAIKNMFKLLNNEGYIILTFPYNELEYCENVYLLPNSSYGKDYSYICQVFSKNEINKWLDDNDCKIIEQEYWKFWDGKFWTEGNLIVPPKKVNTEDLHHITCILIKKGK